MPTAPTRRNFTPAGLKLAEWPAQPCPAACGPMSAVAIALFSFMPFAYLLGRYLQSVSGRPWPEPSLLRGHCPAARERTRTGRLVSPGGPRLTLLIGRRFLSLRSPLPPLLPRRCLALAWCVLPSRTGSSSSGGGCCCCCYCALSPVVSLRGWPPGGLNVDALLSIVCVSLSLSLSLCLACCRSFPPQYTADFWRRAAPEHGILPAVG